ncbi:hypothetical protein [Brevundimonas kwangchunensis]|uniref:hypothetical protein n=1 Tax=Brevundimonas kwangchunensis TaxID=322163 RepID=UPI0031D8C2A5
MMRATAYEVHVHTPDGVSIHAITTVRIVEAFDRCREILQATPDATIAELRLGSSILHSMKRRAV